MWCILPVCRVRVAYTTVRTKCGGFVFWFRDLVGLVGLMAFLGAPYPSKSGLMNKHIVKHIVTCYAVRPYIGKALKSSLDLCRVNVSFFVPCARLKVKIS